MKVLFLTLMIVCNLQGEDLIRELVRKDISNERRDAIVEQLKRSDVSTVAPRILEVMRDHVKADEPGIGSKPWMYDGRSHQAKVWYASAAIWDELFKGRDDPNKAAILQKLLTNHHDEYSIYVILNAMLAHWTIETEQQVFILFQDSKASISSKRQALEALINR